MNMVKPPLATGLAMFSSLLALSIYWLLPCHEKPDLHMVRVRKFSRSGCVVLTSVNPSFLALVCVYLQTLVLVNFHDIVNHDYFMAFI